MSKQITLRDVGQNLVLHLRYDGRCFLDRVTVRGREVVRSDTGVCSAIQLGGRWFTTRADIPTPQVETSSNTVTVSGIRFGAPDLGLSETWRFVVESDCILWRIDRTYLSSGMLDDTYFPGWDFQDMSTWTGALLGHGGVAWGKLFDVPNASYGVHNGKVTFWNKDRRACLRVVPELPGGNLIAVRFSRQPSGIFSFNYSISEKELVPKHGLSRFCRDRQDVWRPFAVKPGQVSVQFTLSALDYDAAYHRGNFPGLDGSAIREICHTIGRIGAVDEQIMGSNGYYSDFAVLHEPWYAQMGLAIDDPDYWRAFGETLDFQRQHAIGKDGRVKSRWSGNAGDALRGTYDEFGFYECQWGWLMDSQTSWLINVAEQFDFTGDRPWLERQKAAGEKVLDYLLRRDTDGNGLVKMLTDSHTEAKGSDWIDVVWAAYENALVNAQTYEALSRWTELEDLLGDAARAAQYREAARKLKQRFNQSTDAGGFWDAKNQCYAYWRDKDGSVHGTNLVVPVNFSAIGYGLCDDPGRRAAILDHLETLMQRESLFFWPLCFFSYAKDEGHPQVNWPFPAYENGDLFLAWGELGTRAYAAHNPALALKYVRNVLSQYAKDGLAFQRYLRASQTGAGNDILANNCSIVVGLYRNLYGVQPKHDRLYLEPHLAPELNGTRLNYRLRDKGYRIDLSVSNYVVAVDHFTIHESHAFALNANARTLTYFRGAQGQGGLALTTAGSEAVDLAIDSWPEATTGERAWSISCQQPGTTIRHTVSGLATNAPYQLVCNGATGQTLRSDACGRLAFDHKFSDSKQQSLRLRSGTAPKDGDRKDGSRFEARAGDFQVAFEFTAEGVKLSSLFDLGRQRELLAAKPDPFFTVMLRRPGTTEYERLHADSGWAHLVRRQTRHGFKIQWAETKNPRLKGIVIIATADADVKANGWHWRLRVEDHNPNWSVSRVIFPQLALRPPGERASVVFPRGPGEVQSGVWDRRFDFHGTYPSGWCSMQFMGAFAEGPLGAPASLPASPRPSELARRDAGAPSGLYCAMHDPWGSAKDMGVVSDPATHIVRLRFDHPIPNMDVSSNAFALSGEAVWQLLRGDWFDAAMVYKTWVTKEARWWPALKHGRRADTPSWMLELDAWAMTGGAPSACVSNVIRFREFLGQPIGFHWYNWHQIPFDNDYPHYFPAKSGFEEAVAQLKRAGVFPMPYINGRLWDTHDRGSEDGEFSRLALPAATKREGGQPWIETYGSKETNGEPVKLAVMCPTTPLWRKTVSETVLRLLKEAGTSAVYVDQIAAAAPALCLDATHGHPLGGGHWWNEGYWRLLDDIRRAKPVAAALTTECNGETFVRWFDAYLTWHWQFDGQVPAFPAVYGGAIQMFGRAYRGGATKDLALRMKAGQQLTYGEQLGWLDPGLVSESDNASFFRQMAHVRSRCHHYFNAGEMARPPKLEGSVPKVKADWQWSGQWWVTTDAVLTGAWRLAGERKALLLFVNVGDEPVAAKVRLDEQSCGIRGKRAKVHVSCGEEKAGPVQELAGLLAQPVTFAPRQAQVWEVCW